MPVLTTKLINRNARFRRIFALLNGADADVYGARYTRGTPITFNSTGFTKILSIASVPAGSYRMSYTLEMADVDVVGTYRPNITIYAAGLDADNTPTVHRFIHSSNRSEGVYASSLSPIVPQQLNVQLSSSYTPICGIDNYLTTSSEGEVAILLNSNSASDGYFNHGFFSLTKIDL